MGRTSSSNIQKKKFVLKSLSRFDGLPLILQRLDYNFKVHPSSGWITSGTHQRTKHIPKTETTGPGLKPWAAPKKETGHLCQAIWQPQNLGENSAHFLFLYVCLASSFPLQDHHICSSATSVKERVIPWIGFCPAYTLCKWQEPFNIYGNVPEKKSLALHFLGQLKYCGCFHSFEILQNWGIRRWKSEKSIQNIYNRREGNRRS